MKPGPAFDLKATVATFFDRAEIERAIGRTQAKALRQIGQRVRFEARDLLVRRKGPADPGDVPHVHSTDRRFTLRFILYYYERDEGRVVVGPAGLTRDPAPGLLEHGGRTQLLEAQFRGQWIPANTVRNDPDYESLPKRSRTVTIEPRPFMVRALEAALPKIPDEFRGQLGG